MAGVLNPQALQGRRFTTCVGSQRSNAPLRAIARGSQGSARPAVLGMHARGLPQFTGFKASSAMGFGARRSPTTLFQWRSDGPAQGNRLVTMMALSKFPEKKGLYDPAFEKDSCGVRALTHPRLAHFSVPPLPRRGREGLRRPRAPRRFC